jgi:hypothetical protein
MGQVLTEVPQRTRRPVVTSFLPRLRSHFSPSGNHASLSDAKEGASIGEENAG